MLYEAAVVGSKEVFEILLRHELDAFAKDEWEQTPMHYAARYGKLDIYDVYLKIEGAFPNAMEMLNIHGESPD